MASEIRVQVQQVSATTSQGQARTHTVLIDRPAAKEGADQGMMGGEMLLVALGGCFISNLLAAIRARNADIQDIHITITGTLDENPSRYTAAHLLIRARYHDAELLQKLVTISERACIVANSLRSAMTLTFEVAGG